MKDKDAFKDKINLMNIYNEAIEPQSTKEETARAVKILDAKYEAADLEKVVEENCQHLSNTQRMKLLELLKKHEKMFSGQLGEWKVRFLSDFRELNKALVRRPFPLPKISDMLQQMEGFTFASAIDLNMGYYHLKLDLETMRICAIVFPWGIYRYRRLPMGVACSPDIFQ
eukprot:scaffold7655_cov91-Skeletonema_menzelii.AAC.1